MIIESKLEVSDQEFDSELGTVQTVPIPGPKGDPGEKGEKGDKGDKGDPGVVKFTVVKELPEQGADDAIYLVPVSGGTAINMYDEYIFVDGVWEKIGSAGVEVNLDDYVKKTDYANANIGGVVKIGSTYNGISIDKDGLIGCYGAEKANIDGRNSRKPICPTIMDYAIKVGLTTNKETWTEEEKASARGQLGALEAKTSDRTSVYAVNSSGEQILIGTCSNATNRGMIPVYSGNGNISVATPTGVAHATTKAYVDGLVGDIESTLDAIIAIQNSLIGGVGV